MIKNKDYWIYESYFMLAGANLYSGCLQTDPLAIAEFDAHSHISYDARGNKLPFALRLLMPAQDVNRNIELLEEKELAYRRWDQNITVQIIVFKDMDKYYEYELDENCIELVV